jgi:thiamine biosynthesis lipoprotein
MSDTQTNFGEKATARQGRHALPFFSVLALLALVAGVIWKSRAHENHLHGSAMGCQWNLEWRGTSLPPEKLKQEVALTLEKWEQVLSQWRPDSDLSRYNRGEAPSTDLSRVLAMAEEIKKQTGGAFDHHILEQVHAAGFGPEGKGVDLSSIGKGFGVDRVCEQLRELGLKDFVFALAGEVKAVGGEWPVDIEKPQLSGGGVLRTIMLRDQAIATSGNYRQFRETKEGIVTHIIDPRTGRSVIRPVSSVTVIAGDSATASSWATALFVLGPEFKGYPSGHLVSWQ